MRLFNISVLILSILVQNNNAARILALFSVQSGSHYKMFQKVLVELTNKGHEVEVISHFPLKENIPRMNDISLAGTLPLMMNNVSMSLLNQIRSYSNMVKFVLYDMGLNNCEYAFQRKEFKDLLTTNKTYDLLITELYATDCMLGFGHFFKIPTVVMTSSVDVPWGAERIGNPDNPSYISSYFLETSVPTTFSERLTNVYMYVTSKLRFAKTVFEMNVLVKNFFGPDIPHMADLANNISLVLLNSHPSFHSPRPMLPNVIEVGGIHIDTPKPLPKRFERVMNRPGSKGVIYLSLGSLFMLVTFDVLKLRALMNAARKLPDYTFLFKLDVENMPPELSIPANVYCENWLPQLDILCHNNTKLFITHGGMLGTQEGIYCGKPMIGIPFFADQMQNIHRGEMMGFMRVMPYSRLNDVIVLETIQSMLQNTRYTKMARRASELFRDRPQSAIDTARFWIEYVIRNDKWYNGEYPEFAQRPLRSPAADMSWYQYYLIDVACVLIVVIVVILYLLLNISQYLRTKLCIYVKNRTRKVKSS